MDVRPRKRSIIAQQEDILLDALFTAQPIQFGKATDSSISAVTQVLEDDEGSKRQVFAELMILSKEQHAQGCTCCASLIWREHARWIKYEETVEEHGTRFSKPHISLLSIQGLLQLKSCLKSVSSGLFDIECESMGEIVDTIVKSWETRHADKISDTKHIDFLKQTLLAKKVHVFGQKTTATTARTKSTSQGETVYDQEENRNSPGRSTPQDITSPLDVTGKVKAQSLPLMRKVAPGCESAVILVGYTNYLNAPICEFVRLKNPIDLYPELPEIPIPLRFLFILLIPQQHSLLNPKDGLEIGQSMGCLMVDDVFSRLAYKAHENVLLADGVHEFLSHAVIVPPGKWNRAIRREPQEDSGQVKRAATARMEKYKDEMLDQADEDWQDSGLQFTRKPFGGLIMDIKRKKKFYISDFTDAFTGRATQILAATLLLFIANVTKIIAFGGIMDHMLEGKIGAEEHLLSGGICGVTYGLFAGQPLTALSATGPTLIFEYIMYEFCKQWQWDFFAIRFWTGCWTALFLMIICATNVSVIVATITRFTEEAFATLVSIIFIYQGLEELVSIERDAPIVAFPQVRIVHPVSDAPWQCIDKGGQLSGQMCFFKPDVFLFSIVLFLGTFIIAVAFKKFRDSGFLSSKLRNAVADLNVSLAVLTMTLISIYVGVDVPKLHVPDEFKPTMEDRPWLVNPMRINHWYEIAAALLPAIFFTILVFMDQQITAVIVNRKDNKLRKGFGYHLDMFVMSVLMVICATIGIPFYVAATVISIMHVESLRQMTEITAPGEKPAFIGVNEQRVTAVTAHVLVALTVLAAPALKFVPLPVLAGIFMYMGFVALVDQQFFNRILLFFMPTKHQPDYPWLRIVHLKKVHLFTAIQMISLAILFIVKHSTRTVSMVFPFMLIVMVLIRLVAMDKLFTKKELHALDDLVPPIRQLFALEHKPRPAKIRIADEPSEPQSTSMDT